MARIRSIKPEFPHSESMGRVSRDARGHFKKSAITAQTRRDIAKIHGCSPGESKKVKCRYCDFEGEIHWITNGFKYGKGWVSFSNLEMDHVIPEIIGGESTVENLVLACRTCNRSKHTKIISDWRGGIHG